MMLPRWTQWMGIILLIVLLVACGGAGGADSDDSVMLGSGSAAEPEVVERDVSDDAAMDEEMASMADEAVTESDMVMATPQSGQANSGDGDDQATSDEQTQGFDRQIIYTAGLLIEVEDPRTTARTLSSLARRYGGFVSGSEVYEVGSPDQKQYRADVQLRIPAREYDKALEELRGLGEVLRENITTQDVTAEYVDLQARVDNMLRTEDEIQALLAEARARNDDMEDILRIYEELTSIRSQIESYQGQLNVLGDLVSLSTINIELTSPEVEGGISTILDDPWQPGETVREAFDTLIGGLQGLIDFTIYVTIVLVPYLLIFGLLGLVAFTVWRRLMNRGDSVSAPSSDPPSAPPRQET